MIEYLERLRKFWFPNTSAFLWLLIAFPALLFFQTVVHEGTHDVVARFHGDSPKLAPFPHLTSNGGFQVGVTIPGNKTVSPRERKTCDPNDPPQSRPRLAGWIGWPQIVALLIVAGLTALFAFVEVTNPYVAYLLRTWLFGAAVDFTFNSAKILFGICDDGQDWARVMIRGDLNTTLFWLLTLGLWIGVFLCIGWVAWPEHEPPRELDCWEYRGIGLAFLFLSATAVVFSLGVSDSNIDKSSLAFWFFFVGQILAVVGYIVYVIKAFRTKTP